MATVDPFELLSHYDTIVRQLARKLPQQVVGAEWMGVELQIGAQSFLTPILSVVEIVSTPAVTRVPGAKAWLIGVMNVRGSLIPVTDVAYWLTGEPTTVVKSRVLVIERDQERYGLQFDRILGMQRLTQVTLEAGSTVQGPWAAFVSQTLVSAEKKWPVLDLKCLLSQDTFYQTALVS